MRRAQISATIREGCKISGNGQLLVIDDLQMQLKRIFLCAERQVPAHQDNEQYRGNTRAPPFHIVTACISQYTQHQCGNNRQQPQPCYNIDLIGHSS